MYAPRFCAKFPLSAAIAILFVCTVSRRGHADSVEWHSAPDMRVLSPASHYKERNSTQQIADPSWTAGSCSAAGGIVCEALGISPADRNRPMREAFDNNEGVLKAPLDETTNLPAWLAFLSGSNAARGGSLATRMAANGTTEALWAESLETIARVPHPFARLAAALIAGGMFAGQLWPLQLPRLSDPAGVQGDTALVTGLDLLARRIPGKHAWHELSDEEKTRALSANSLDVRPQVASVPVTVPRFRAYGPRDLEKGPLYELLMKVVREGRMTEQDLERMRAIAMVLPFKMNNYVVAELIDWSKVPHDPVYRYTFPQEGMLNLRPNDEHFPNFEAVLLSMLREGAPKEDIERFIQTVIYPEMNPHPSGQDLNVPVVNGQPVKGVQSKYVNKEELDRLQEEGHLTDESRQALEDGSLLLLVAKGQTCHVYCAYCYRWPQFVGVEELQFSLRDPDLLRQFLRLNSGLKTAIFSGGDVMTMSAKNIQDYVNVITEFPNIKVIRFGTKALTYWPYRFTTDPDAQELLDVFRNLGKSGISVEIMAHFTTPRELETKAARDAVFAIKSTGAIILNQFPLLRGVNDDPHVLAALALRMYELGIVPHYVFIDRPTGPHRFFAVPIEKAYQIVSQSDALITSGEQFRTLAMSTEPGKIWIKGFVNINGQKRLQLKFVRARDTNWIKAGDFFAVPKPGLTWDDVYWLDDLMPPEGGDFFFEKDMAARKKEIQEKQSDTGQSVLGR